MSEQGQPHYTDEGFLRRSADRMADAIERLVLIGHLDSRSAAADAALNYRSPAFDRLDTIEEMAVALEMMLKCHEQLMPGVKHISCQDYKVLNDGPIAARSAIAKARAVKKS